jgi:hypothetical protein
LCGGAGDTSIYSGSLWRAVMSYMRGDLLTKTRKLVKGLAKPAPTWLKAMEESVRYSLTSILCGVVHVYCSSFLG